MFQMNKYNGSLFAFAIQKIIINHRKFPTLKDTHDILYLS